MCCSCCMSHPVPPAIYTLSLHDALPILSADQSKCGRRSRSNPDSFPNAASPAGFLFLLFGGLFHTAVGLWRLDRKSTRLNSSHQIISYAVFCLKKKKKNDIIQS